MAAEALPVLHDEVPPKVDHVRRKFDKLLDVTGVLCAPDKVEANRRRRSQFSSHGSSSVPHSPHSSPLSSPVPFRRPMPGVGASSPLVGSGSMSHLAVPSDRPSTQKIMQSVTKIMDITGTIPRDKSAEITMRRGSAVSPIVMRRGSAMSPLEVRRKSEALGGGSAKGAGGVSKGKDGAGGTGKGKEGKWSIFKGKKGGAGGVSKGNNGAGGVCKAKEGGACGVSKAKEGGARGVTSGEQGAVGVSVAGQEVVNVVPGPNEEVVGVSGGNEQVVGVSGGRVRVRNDQEAVAFVQESIKAGAGRPWFLVEKLLEFQKKFTVSVTGQSAEGGDASGGAEPRGACGAAAANCQGKLVTYDIH